jgi:hypothetical protein
MAANQPLRSGPLTLARQAGAAASIRSQSDAHRRLTFRRAPGGPSLPCRDQPILGGQQRSSSALVWQALCDAAVLASLRVGTWKIAGARREQTNQVDLDAVVAGVRAL